MTSKFRSLAVAVGLLGAVPAIAGADDLACGQPVGFAWRGLHLDVSRHFFGVPTVKRFLDRMAALDYNVFHWHLTDCEGWRFPVEGLPKLTNFVATARRTKGDGKGFRDLPGEWTKSEFYTADEIREVVRYAAKLGITVVPEAEFPGHGHAPLKAYPELASGTPGVFDVKNPKTYEFMTKVIDAMCELFPGEYVHIGGDEVPEGANALMGRLAHYVATKGRRAVVWEEAYLAGVLDPADRPVVMSWNGMDPGRRAAAAGFDVVFAPTSHCYFDYPQGDPGDGLVYPAWAPQVPPLKTRAFDPYAGVPAGDRRHILGAQGNNWTELTLTEDELFRKCFPRAAALAEALNPGLRKDRGRDTGRFFDRRNASQSDK